MNVNIISKLNFFDSIQEYFKSHSFDDLKIKVTEIELGELQYIKIYVDSELDHLIRIRIPALSTEIKVTEENMFNELKNFITQIFGLKVIKLTQIPIIDLEGNRVKDNIEILVRDDISNSVSSIMNYCRFKNTIEFNDKLRIFNNSQILQNILENHELLFSFNDKFFKITQTNNEFFIHYNKIKLSKCFDFLIHNSSIGHLDNIMNPDNKWTVLLKAFVAGENEILNGEKARQLLKNYKNLKYLIRFIEHAPKFNDIRDITIEKLKAHLITRINPAPTGEKSRYLELSHGYVPRNKNPYTLDAFLNQ